MSRARIKEKIVYQPTLDRERELRTFGYTRIAGVDEAGRGPLAGPVVAGAVIFPCEDLTQEWAQLNDSKQLTHEVRELLFGRITSNLEWGVGIVDAATIDEINIRQASWLAMQLAVKNLSERVAANAVLGMPHYVLIDGLGYGPGPWPYEALVKGDCRSLSIAAASIVAKVTRDRIMERYCAEYSGYGFAVHKGYPTPQHLLALEKLGPCPIHRKSFSPIYKLSETLPL